MKTLNKIYPALNIVNELVYDKCGYDLINLKNDSESLEYSACSFTIAGKTIQHRLAKITPTKIGQFVTIWQRNQNGITAPFSSNSNFDFIIITAQSADKLGQFVFSKSLLIERGIITHNGKEGKRGIRVYPPWDTPTNTQAKATQTWQTKYFFSITNSTDLELFKKLLGKQ